MALFEYQALDERGRSVKGTVESDSIRTARQKLKSQKIFPTDLKEASLKVAQPKRDLSALLRSDRVSLKDLSVATRQLATLVTAGLPLVGGLAALADQTDDPNLRRILVDVKDDVEEGSTFAKALAKFPKAFPTLFVNMVASGEASGTLDSTLSNLADYLEGQVELRRKVGSALTYPIVMLLLCTAVVIGLVAFVIPKIVDIFIKQKQPLPIPTQIVLALSNAVVGYWYLFIIAIVVTVFTVRWYYKTPKGREQTDILLLRLPLYGPLVKKISTARVAKTLATLLSSGVGLLTALEITKNITSNVILRKAIDDARLGVQEGRSLAKELSKNGAFPILLGHMIAVGEKSGELEGMLSKAGRAYENEVNATLGRLTSLLEPLMMILVGGIVLGIVLSVMLPMADMISIIQG